MAPSATFGPNVLDIDCAAETTRICDWLIESIGTSLRRRGAVIAISGGVDSAVCAALAVRALGAPRVYGLLLPEQDSSSDSARRGEMVTRMLGLEYELFDIAPALHGLGCYRLRDEAVRSVFPEYSNDWKCKIAIAGGLSGGLNYFKLIVEDPLGVRQEKRLPLRAYLQIVAATNHKQRIRKTIEYYHADRLNYAVIGTPNRLEFDQGFFVKNGDGAADVKPIAHLYKTQVYALARHLGLPDEICSAQPTTDTYSLAQGQDEFYFALHYDRMDLALWAHNHGIDAAEACPALGLGPEEMARVFADIESKRRTARYLLASPMVMGDSH